ncbi:MAG: glutamate racemase [Candidatus Zipacnadales bacterium]
MFSDRQRPIGVFDSGAGGLTVVRELFRLLPREQIIYFGDTGYVPYGPRPLAEIQRFALDACRFLEDRGAKLIVMGCNMSSAMALEIARTAASCPVLGTVQAGARLAVAATRAGRIGVAATEGTVKSRAYARAITKLLPQAKVMEQSCPLLVPAIEAGLCDGLLEEAVARSLSPLREWGPDTVVLGCTHYPLVREIIQAYIGEAVRLVDPAEALAAEAVEVLRKKGLLSPQAPRRPIVAYASGAADSLDEWYRYLMGEEIGPVQQIDIHADLASSRRRRPSREGVE